MIALKIVNTFQSYIVLLCEYILGLLASLFLYFCVILVLKIWRIDCRFTSFFLCFNHVGKFGILEL